MLSLLACNCSLLHLHLFYSQPFPSFLPFGGTSLLYLVPGPPSVCLLSLPALSIFCPWLQFWSLHSVAPHLKSQFHSFTHQPAALGYESIQLFASGKSHEIASYANLEGSFAFHSDGARRETGCWPKVACSKWELQVPRTCFLMQSF